MLSKPGSPIIFNPGQPSAAAWANDKYTNISGNRQAASGSGK